MVAADVKTFNFIRKFKYLIQNITVEPMLGLLVIPSVLSSLANQNLNLDKACLVNLNYSKEICTALKERKTDHYEKQDEEVSYLVATMGIWTSLMSFFPVVLVMFAGSWSDRNKNRKAFMLTPILGEFLGVVSLILCVFFFYDLPMQVSAFSVAFFTNITGGWTVMLMAVYSYMADITTVETRTVRIGFLDVFFTCGVPFGTALSGVLLKDLGYYGVYSISATLYILGLTYGIFYVKEAYKLNSSKENCLQEILVGEEKSNQGKQYFAGKGSAVLYLIKDFFDMRHIKETLRVILGKGSGNRRQKIILLVIVMIVVEGPLHGEMTVMYLFMRYRFNWDEVQYSMFSTYSVIAHLIGTSFSVGVFSHMLKIDDALIGVMSCLSKILAGFVYAFAQTDWQVYLGPLVDIVNGTSFIAMRSIASKLVPPEELGKLNSLYGACEALTPLIYGPMYAFVYAHTMDTLPGAFLLLGGALTLPAVIIFGWMYTQHRGDRMKTLASRKSSIAQDVLKTLRVDALVLTPTILDTLESEENEDNKGQVNLAFQEGNIPLGSS